MNIKKYFYLTMFLTMFFIPNFVSAKNTCSEDQLNKYKNDAKDIKINIEHDTDEFFYTNVTGLKDGLYLLSEQGLKFEVDETKFSSVSGYNIEYLVLSKDCSGIIKSIKVEYPAFNEYSNSEECIYNPDFKYCFELYEKSDSEKITEEKFNKEFKKYENEIINNSSNNKFSKLISENYLWFIIGGILTILIIVICIITIKKKSKRVL